ncbi:hypothetical protein HKK80_03185 [Halonotius sp. F2-221B]|uniref:DUF5816 domain-containing protein n=1 Tax=Halonotius sp. F2-221B TaxID=2731620 RepID=UPI00398BAFE1
MSVDAGDGDVLTAAVRTADGTGYAAYNERADGSVAPFYVVYADSDRTDRYGYICGACGSLAVGMDPMGRLDCAECDNSRKAAQWDAAYL